MLFLFFVKLKDNKYVQLNVLISLKIYTLALICVLKSECIDTVMSNNNNAMTKI